MKKIQSSTIRINEPVLVKQKGKRGKHGTIVITLDYYFLKKVAKHIAKTARCIDCGKKINCVVNSTPLRPQRIELKPGEGLTMEYKLEIK